MSVKKPMRYAHSEGHLDVCYDDAGNHILTCGPDGDVRVFKGFDDDDSVSYTIGDVTYAIAFKKDHFYTSTDDHCVQAFLFDDGQADGIVTRFTAPVTHIVLNSAGTKLIAAASDFVIKVVDVATRQQEVLEGHTAPVLSLALHPDENLLASSSCDGSVVIWRLADRTVVKKIDCLAKTNDFLSSKTLCRLTWSGDGKYLVVPVEKEVRGYDTETWQLSFTLTDSSIKELVSIVTFSPCGSYLAGSCRDGVIVVWHFDKREVVTRDKHEKSLTITALAWNPNGSNELAFCDNVGSLGLIQNAVPTANRASTEADENFADLFDDSNDEMLVEASAPAVLPVTTAAVPDDDDDDDDDNMTAIVQLRKQMSRILDDDESRDTVLSDKQVSDVTVATPAPVVKGYEPTPLQSAFQPASTPCHLSHRFMVWNAVGVIIQYNTDEENSINVEFHNTATHHAMHISNTLAHTMADLSADAVLLACPADAQTPSQLVCMHFGSWDNCKEWTVPMAEGEDIKAICIGQGWVAAATDSGCVRLFSVSGVQRDIVSLPGPVVAMASFDTQLMVVYHTAAGVPGDQCLGVRLVEASGQRRRRRPDAIPDRLPVSPKSVLVWIGFSAEGTPFSVDSHGIARMLNRGVSNCWTPVANLTKHCKGKSDHYWVVGIHENPQQLRAIHCKGSRYPVILPRPTVTLLNFELPLCELDTDKGALEETYVRAKLFGEYVGWWRREGYECDDSLEADALMPQQEALMKLFALACKLGRESRAEEVGRLMSSHAVQLAIKYASRVRRLALAGRLSDLARSRADALQAGRDDDGDDGDDGGDDDDDGDAAERGVTNGHGTPRCSDTPESTDGLDDDPMAEGREEREEGEDGAPLPGPMLNLKPKKIKVAKPKYILCSQDKKKNPFKMHTQIAPSDSKGSRVFDTVEKSKTNTVVKNSFNTVMKKKKKSGSGQQSKLFSSKTSVDKATNQTEDEVSNTDHPVENGSNAASKRSRVTPFQLWWEASQPDLEEECPDVSPAELTVLGARRFKELSAQQKQEWQTKASDGNGAKKRRVEDTKDTDDTDDSVVPKTRDRPTAEKDNKTTAKLANFAFAKS